MIRDYAKVSCNNISTEANYKTNKKLGAVFIGTFSNSA